MEFAMNNILKLKKPVLWLMLFMTALISGLILPGCDDKDSLDEGDPVVRYVRITNPDKSDSLVTHAFMGTTVAIIGENLINVKEVWFNDQKAKLNMAFITHTSIIVTIPNEIPEEVSNEMTLVTGKNVEVKHPFGVDVPAPFVESMLCEYVKAGETAVIRGNFFLDDPNIPLEVLFPGNLKGEVLDVTLREIKVKVPQNVGVGPIVVKSLYGSTRSTFYFKDDRNILLDFDTKFGAGWRPGKTQGSNPAGISGNYVAMRGQLNGDWDWVEDDLAFELWGQAAGRPAGPLFQGDPENMVMKFEAYVVNPWSGGWMQLILSPHSTNNNSVNSNPTLARGFWRPWETSGGTFKTDGWITVTVPLADFKYSHNGSANNLKLVYPDNCGSLTFFVWGPVPNPCNVFICVDNVRIVPR